MLTIYDLQCENFISPIGISTDRPRFSWKLRSDMRGCAQCSYQIQLATDSDFESLVWDSGRVAGDQSQLYEYKGEPLTADTRYFFRVRIEDNHREKSDWVQSAFETGIFDHNDFRADFIASPLDKPEDSCGIYFRHGFAVDGEIARAKAYVTALGMYDFHMNGSKVGDAYFAPGFLSYNKHLQVQAYDVTDMLRQGENVVGAVVGAGWYKGDLVWKDHRNFSGSKNALFVQLHITYKDGRKQVVMTGEDWQSGLGPITFSELYHGETYDANLADPNWCNTTEGGHFIKCELIKFDKSVMCMQTGEFVREQGIIRPIEKIKTPAGETVFDFGQNMVGYVRVKVSGNKGDRVRLGFAEVLDKDGNFYTANMRSARNDINYILSGEGEEVFQPHFTFQGFRYMRVIEFPGFAQSENFEGVVLDSDMRTTGEFECSNELINRLVKNVQWGFKGNSVDVPTDCPQRDERLGWTGDAQVFIRTACFLRDARAFYSKWLDDMACDQLENGGIPHVIPDVLKNGDSACGWADAATICPWTLYLCYGDKRELKKSYPMMKKWVEHVRSVANKGVYWDSGSHFGDWLALDAKEGSYNGATPNDLTATAYYAYSTLIMSKAAEVLGYSAESANYMRLHNDIAEFFKREFFTPNGRLAVPTQTAHVLALMFDLVPENAVQRTIDALVKLIETNDNHLTTGFLGTPYLCYALSRYGRTDVAIKLLMREEFPSWLYSVKQGATTIWEHWDGIKPDGSFWSDAMNSYNHYAYGCILDWIVETLAGINVDERMTGYKRFTVMPQLPNEWNDLKCSYDSVYGKIAVELTRGDAGLNVKLTVPENTSCVFKLGDFRKDFGSGTYEFDCPDVPVPTFETAEAK